MSFIKNQNLGFVVILFTAVIFISGFNASAQKTIEHISATATGTSTQMGKIVSVDLRISAFSTPDDQKALLAAFAEGGDNGLANALDKMKAKGRISITGTLGYDVNYIREFKMPDGSRKIRFVTDRQIRFGEAWSSTRSLDYQISIGEISISKEKGKSTGTLMPATKVKLNKENEIELETYQNPWNLTNIKVWK